MRGRPSSASGISCAPASRPKLSKRGLAPSSANAWAIGPPSLFMLSVPQSTIATDSGKALPSATCRASSRSAWRAPSATAKALGIRNGSKPCRLRPVGRIAGLRRRSPAGAGRTKRPSSARSRAGSSCSSRSMRSVAASSWNIASVASSLVMPPAARAAAGVAPATSASTAARSGRWPWLASAEASSRSTRAMAGMAAPITCMPCGISVYSSSRIALFSAAIRVSASSVQSGSAGARSTPAACAWSNGASWARSVAASGARPRQRSSDALRSSRPR